MPLPASRSRTIKKEQGMNSASVSLPKSTLSHYAPPREPYLEVLHVDVDFIVISKQSGLLSVPGRTPDKADSIATRAQSLYPESTIVHRLDMETSGLMVLARNRPAHRHLSRQFEQRQIAKTYVAEVWGQLAEDTGKVDAPLICDWPNRPRQIIDWERGKSALTRWQVLSRDHNSTRMLLMPITGRSHQLRVHLASLGHPILGDSLYADDKAQRASDRLKLHAQSLVFQHPTAEREVKFIASAPF